MRWLNNRKALKMDLDLARDGYKNILLNGYYYPAANDSLDLVATFNDA